MKFLAAIILFAASNAHAEPFAATATSGPEAWKKYDVRGVQLGMKRVELVKKGFTCGKTANSRCWKIMDKRCDGHAKCEVKTDAFGSWFEVNGVKTQVDYVSCATTESDAALVYDIHYSFGPRQMLTSDSTLGKALQAKYGDSTSVEEGANNDKVGGGRMLWWNSEIGSNGPNVIVECNGTNGEGPQCTLSAGDNGIQAMERSKQEDIDAKRKKAAQPKTAPAL
jgi:hypothetical protein